MAGSLGILTARLILHPVTLAEAQGSTPGLPCRGISGPQIIRSTATATASAGGRPRGKPSTAEPALWAYYQIRRRIDGAAVGARGKGYAAEALAALTAWALSSGASHVHAETMPNNPASQHSLGNAGLRLVSRGDEVLRYSTR
ncbi:GNAT family N-acetyltransferase [Paenarthrobacter sp. PH39-S1]|uniref:GNAT family N-acetyltransferase n=1 Tax=Paenarthrobacter sp. PH39-S1 TaxID=3046204 RepID=UPI0024B8D049|nr:GNAT family N-acetyltransferase [Paenarthrobacter sp. PH39-S1]MDJ0357057.1 GNAT family N-acetyltransferase [Paenarthrobacter sp. PH39-S1]